MYFIITIFMCCIIAIALFSLSLFSFSYYSVLVLLLFSVLFPSLSRLLSLSSNRWLSKTYASFGLASCPRIPTQNRPVEQLGRRCEVVARLHPKANSGSGVSSPPSAKCPVRPAAVAIGRGLGPGAWGLGGATGATNQNAKSNVTIAAIVKHGQDLRDCRCIDPTSLHSSLVIPLQLI